MSLWALRKRALGPVPGRHVRCSLHRVSHPRASREERGAATVEFTGVTAVAVVLVLSLLLVVGTSAPAVADKFRWAVCMVTTLGQGPCGAPTSAADHKPPQPCVVSSQTRSLETEIAVAVVTLGDGRRFEVAKLSDGRYRVTLLKGGSVGLETGVGGGVTLTVNERTVGGSAVADVGGSLDMANGRVWYTSDPREVERMLSENTEDAWEHVVIGSGGPVRWIWERGQDAVGAVTGNGDYEFPEPDETYTEVGATVDARAEVTGGADRANAEIGQAQVLGERKTRQGNTTVYFKTTVNAAAGLQVLGSDVNGSLQFQGGQGSGQVELLTAATYDADGQMIEVATTAVAAGEAKGVVTALFGGSGDSALGDSRSGAAVYQAILPVRGESDEQVATEFLLSMGVTQLGGTALQAAALPSTVGSTARFLDAARQRGYTTRQTFTNESNTPFAFDVSGKLGLELGANASVETSSRTSTGSHYWDGARWVERRECTT